MSLPIWIAVIAALSAIGLCEVIYCVKKVIGQIKQKGLAEWYSQYLK